MDDVFDLYYWLYGGKTPEPPPAEVPAIKNPYESCEGVDELVAKQDAILDAEVDAMHKEVLTVQGHPSAWASWTYLSSAEQDQLLVSMGLVGVSDVQG